MPDLESRHVERDMESSCAMDSPLDELEREKACANRPARRV
ncbi:MAG TPA: hypothetical protein VFS19_04405 [Planctomycetota bacterium]|nr:hypothetical protein [Planctomycetota bacterium]